MNSLNSILIEGVLKEDPKFRTTPKGTAVCTFEIVSKRFFVEGLQYEPEHDPEEMTPTPDRSEGKEEVSHFSIEAWRTQAKAVHERGKKGRGVRIVGRLREVRWNGPDGKPKSRVSIVAEHIEFRPEFKEVGKNSTGKRR